MRWVLLAIGLAIELLATTLKLSDGFTKLSFAAITRLCYGLAFYVMPVVVRTMPAGIAYSVRAGGGIAGDTLIGARVFGDALDGYAYLGIGLIMAGVIVLNGLSTVASAQRRVFFGWLRLRFTLESSLSPLRIGSIDREWHRTKSTGRVAARRGPITLSTTDLCRDPPLSPSRKAPLCAPSPGFRRRSDPARGPKPGCVPMCARRVSRCRIASSGRHEADRGD